jgi:TRAP-type uncharacterized transport system fused permease subunit
VTPPVALSAYAAAGISGANLWRTGTAAFMLAIPGFLIPYAFTINPALLLQGSWAEIVPVVATAMIGLIGLASAFGGYAFGPMPMPARIVLFIASPFLVAPDTLTDAIGICGMAAVLGYQLWRYKVAPGRRAVAVRE